MINRDGGLVVTGYITTTDGADTYPTHKDNLGKGGVHSVFTLVARDGISTQRRSEGMQCFVIEELSMYQLVGGITNDYWTLIYNIIDGNINFNIKCATDYVLIGDYDGNIIASPQLLDARLDLVEMRKSNLLIGSQNHKFPNAQVLDKLIDGFMYNNVGKVSTYSRIPLDKLPVLNAITIGFEGLDYGIREVLQGTSSGNAVASYDIWINLINTLITFKTTPWILTKPGILPGEISFPFAQYISNLTPYSVLIHTTTGIIDTVTLGVNQIIRGSPTAPVTLIASDALTELEAKVEAIEENIVTIEETLTTLQEQVTALDITVTALQAQVTTIQAQITAIQAVLAILQGQILTIFGTLGDHGSRIAALEQAIIDLNTRIDNLNFPIVLTGDVVGTGDTENGVETELKLTLDEIKVAEDTVNLNTQRITNLSNTAKRTSDAVNINLLVSLLKFKASVTWQTL
jgi:hypothetical protein